MSLAIVSPPEDLPEITIGVDIQRMADAAISVLADDSSVFTRGGQLVSVASVPDRAKGPKPKIGRAKGAPVIYPIVPGVIRSRLSVGARWIKYSGTKKEHVSALPPDFVVAAITGLREWGGVRYLVSVATSPLFKPDGSILQNPGYDEDTGILYWPRERYIEVSENPTLEDAKGALAALKDVVCDFPFAKPAHCSAWLAGVLTMLARPAIDGCVPMFAVDATTRGTGKSRMVDAATRIAHGQDVARTSLPSEDDEMRKRILAIVVEGDPAVCLDNISSIIVLPSLDSVLTSTTWKDRELGRNVQVAAPHRAVWWATGNNLSMGGDLSRRTLHIRMESALENPEERADFKHEPLLPWIDRERKRLVAAALTVLRAYHLAGRPYTGPVWGSFEEWTRLIVGALVWAGEPDPMTVRASASEELDDDRQMLRCILEGIERLQADNPLEPGAWLTSRDIINALYPDTHPGEKLPPDGYDELRDAISAATRATNGRAPEATRVGKLLQKWRGRVLGGKRLVNGEARKTVSTWRVTKV